MVDQSKPTKRRWSPGLRFSLRTLMVLITVLAVWLGLHMNQVQRQREAVRAIENYGGSVRYDYQYNPFGLKIQPAARIWEPEWLVDLLGLDFFHTVWEVDLARYHGEWRSVENDTEQIAACFGNLPHVKRLLLQGGQATDEAMRHVARLLELEELYLFPKKNGRERIRPSVSARGIARLMPLKKLQTVYVDGGFLGDESLAVFGKFQQLEVLAFYRETGAFTDEGLKQLAHLTHLRVLEFSVRYGSAEFTDAGLAHLQRLQNLAGLHLRGRLITDRGLDYLTALPNLGELHLVSNSVTPAAIQSFRRRVPRAEFSKYSPRSQDVP